MLIRHINRSEVQFEVSSPEELLLALGDSAHLKEVHFAEVRVWGPHVLTRPFHFPKTSSRALRSALRAEAAEVLSLPDQDVELAYQVLTPLSEIVQGIYTAMPRQAVLAYRDCFKDSRIIPLSITSALVGAVRDFLKKGLDTGTDYCLVALLREGVVGVVVFSDNEPMLFRELYDVNEHDLEGQIADTIHYACSRSANKKINQIYITGETAGHDELVSWINSQEQPVALEASREKAVWMVNEDALNQLRHYALSRNERGAIILGLSAFIGGCVIVLAVLGLRLMVDHLAVQRADALVNARDYQTALELQDQLRRLNHDK